MRAEGVLTPAVDRIGGEPISARMARRAPIKHLDPTLLFSTIVLAAFGIVMVFSATAGKQEAAGLDPALFLKRQIAFLAGGLLLVVVVNLFDYKHLKVVAVPMYGVALVALGLVLTPAGEVVSGARRWIDLGAFQAQPSEMAKLALIVVLSAYLAKRKTEVRWRHVLVSLVIMAIPAVLILLEPDLGTAMVFVALVAATLLLAGAKVRHFFMMAAAGLIVLVTALQTGMVHDYQIDRVTAFMDANPDVQSEGYNLIQSKIAIASGGLHGKGLHAANTQTSLDFVPEQHTDFIFTAVGEQLGFIGSSALLGLFALLIWRALRIASLSRDLFGTLLAGGIASLWAFQLFVNLGMTMGIMPITGIPLPFVSYGGSSLVTHVLAAGLLLNIHMRRFV
jgi:rod shape determining protein RodA